jgi:hypothetical protein
MILKISLHTQNNFRFLDMAEIPYIIGHQSVSLNSFPRSTSAHSLGLSMFFVEPYQAASPFHWLFLLPPVLFLLKTI